jgi:hypothetical protein
VFVKEKQKTMINSILLSIKPKYAEMIFSGEKKMILKIDRDFDFTL